MSFYRIYIICFTDFNEMQNKNAKQNEVNSMWREGLPKRLYMYKICDKLVLEHIAIFTGKHLSLFTPFKYNKVADLQACNFIEMRI